MQDQTHDEQTVQEREEEITQLKRWLEHFADTYRFFSSRKERLEDLMRRQSAKQWKPEKVARMVRRLMTANKEIEQAEGVLDRCSARLSQLGVEVDVVSRSAVEKAA